MRVINKLVRILEVAMLYASGVGIIITMLTTVADVVMRYFLHQPLAWWYDVLTNYIIIAIFYLGFSEALYRAEHLSIDALVDKMPEKIIEITSRLVYIIISPLLLGVAYIGISSSIDSFINKEVLAGYYAWVVWPTKTIAALSFLVLGMRSILIAFNNKKTQGK